MSADAAPSVDPDSGAPSDRSIRLARCLERAQGGDLRALNDVVHDLNPLLWHVARSHGLAESDAADVVQTTWLELLRRLHQIRSPQALTAWLVTATRREAWRARSRQRRYATEGSEALQSLPDGEPDLDERLVTDEIRRVLLRHYQRLSQRCRMLLRIVALVDRPDYSAVAQALEMPRGSIGPTRGRCLAKLREMLLADPAWSPT